jgi:hypothetical protein
VPLSSARLGKVWWVARGAITTGLAYIMAVDQVLDRITVIRSID